jgi:SpoIID/LytB domain protein
MRRALAITALALLPWALVPGPASAQIGGPIGAPVVFRPKPQTMLTIAGRGPFRGTIEVQRQGSGITVINELGLDDYVAGVREVPGRWPMEALKAQAVAARTYALWERDRGYWRRFGFDVCGSVSCQVYQGADAEADERGRRWVQAVRATAGQVLFYRGRPALARYHASSGGRTLPNEVVYPSSGPRPYLRSVDDPQDRVSPLHRWTVDFPRADLEAILHKAIRLAGTLADVEASEPKRLVNIRTLGGELEMSSVRFREVISATAPQLFPARYPGTRSDGRTMPATLPSSRFSITKTSQGFRVNGRGYGHGVGMSQWGAMGRALGGASYVDILSAYYTGLKPTTLSHTTTIRVAVVQGAPNVGIGGDGAFGVDTGGQTLASSTVGGWTVVTSGIRSLQVSPPQGFQLPLVLTGVTAPKELFVDPPKRGRTLDVGFVVPKPAQLTGIVMRKGSEVARARTVVEAGEGRLAIPLDPGKLARRDTYHVELNAFDGTSTVVERVDVVLERPANELPLRAAAASVFALAVYGVWRRRRRASA